MFSEFLKSFLKIDVGLNETYVDQQIYEIYITFALAKLINILSFDLLINCFRSEVVSIKDEPF